MPYDTKITHGAKLISANDGGQKPPTESNPVRQRYQLACHSNNGGNSNNSGHSNSMRTKTRSRQYNRGY